LDGIFKMLKSYLKYVILFLTLIIFYGCTPSSIKLGTKKGLASYNMFGKNGARDFTLPVTVGHNILLKWESEINGSFPNSSVTTYDNYVFINDLSGRVYCFDATDGKVIGALKHDGAVYTTPVIDGNNIIFAAAEGDNNLSLLYYYNFLTGKMLFEKEIPGRIMTEMIKTEQGLYFNTENGMLFCYNLSGEKIWEFNTKARTHSSPALGNNIIVFGNDNGEIVGIRAKDGKLLYKEKTGEAFFCGASIDGNTIYIGNDNGNLYAIDLMTGKIIWQFDTGSRIAMTPAFNLTHVIIGNLKGELFSIDKLTGNLHWRTNTRGVLSASPLLTENMIILPDLNEAYHFVDLKKGEILNTYLIEGRGKLTPVIFNEVLYIGYDNGIVRAYEFTD